MILADSVFAFIVLCFPDQSILRFMFIYLYLPLTSLGVLVETLEVGISKSFIVFIVATCFSLAVVVIASASDCYCYGFYTKFSRVSLLFNLSLGSGCYLVICVRVQWG